VKEENVVIVVIVETAMIAEEINPEAGSKRNPNYFK